MTGHVKATFKGSDGGRYGFIVPEGKKVEDKASQVFFHENDLEVGCKLPEKGVEVEYELVPHCPWLRAQSVRPLSKRVYAPVRPIKGGAYGTD